MSGLALRLFGPPQVERDGTVLHIGRRKAVALLAYLAVTRRSHGRDHLAALLWPEMSQRRARSMLRSVLVMLHHAIGQQWLRVFDDQIALDDQPDLLVDVTRFRHLLASVAAHRHASLAACNACVLALADAADIAPSPLLAGFALPDAPEFDLWQSMQADSLQRELAEVLEQLAVVHAGAGRNEVRKAIDYACRWLALDPLHEPAHRLLMLLFAESGDRAAALRQFDECSRMLAAELDAEPSPETVDLRDRIVAGDARLTAAELDPGAQADKRVVDHAGGGALPPGESGFHGFPVAPTGFVGRVGEVEYVAARLSDPACHLLTIVGPGGMGKTRLAIEAARALAPRFADGAWFVDLAPVSAVAAVPAAILRALEAPGTGSTEAEDRLLHFLAGRQMLLVLDNFEHLLGAADLVTQMLAAAPAVSILVTARAHLQLQQEWLLPLEGLATPPAPGNQGSGADGLHQERAGADLPVDLGAYDATRLFLQSVRRQRPDFRADNAGSERVAHICRLLEGMPLAIELTASWARRLSLDLLAHEVEDGLRRLASTARDVLPRHRNMVAVFDHSWQLLNAREQTILRTLSLLRGGFTLEAAEAVAQASVSDLAGLLDASWIRLRPSGRYDIHELVRQYCEGHLSADPAAADQARSRHCAFFGNLLGKLTKRMNYQQSVMTELMADFGNLQVAWQWGVEHGQMDMARDMTISLFFIAEMLGWYHFVIQSYAPIATTLEHMIAAPTTDLDLRNGACVVLAWMENAQAFIYNHLGQAVQARRSAEHLQRLAESMEESASRDELLLLYPHPMAWISFTSGDVRTAYALFSHNLDIFQAAANDFTLYGSEIGAKFWSAHALVGIAASETIFGHYQAAVKRWEEVLALREAMGEQRFMAFNLCEYAETVTFVGDLEFALGLAQRGLAFSEACGDQVGVAEARLRLGTISAEQGQWAVAVGYLQQCLAFGRQSGNRGLQVGALVTLAQVALSEGDIAAAMAHCNEAMAAASVSLPYLHLAAVLVQLGQCSFAAGDLPAARRYYAQALGQAPNSAAWYMLDALWGMAQVIAAEGDVATAAHIARQVAQDPATAASTRAAIGRWYPALFVQESAISAAVDLEAAEQGRALLVATLAAT